MARDTRSPTPANRPPTRHRGNHVSKASRRRQRPGTNPSTQQPASPPPPPTTQASTDPATADTAGSPPPTATPSGTPRPSSSRPVSTRAGRRERQRAVTPPTFLERYRTAIIVVAALAGVALLSAFVF